MRRLKLAGIWRAKPAQIPALTVINILDNAIVNGTSGVRIWGTLVMEETSKRDDPHGIAWRTPISVGLVIEIEIHSQYRKRRRRALVHPVSGGGLCSYQRLRAGAAL